MRKHNKTKTDIFLKFLLDLASVNKNTFMKKNSQTWLIMLTKYLTGYHLSSFLYLFYFLFIIHKTLIQFKLNLTNLNI